MNKYQKTSLLIMAAGLGSRYGGDKQIDRLGPDGEILLQYSIFDALKAGFNKIVLIIKPSYRQILEELCADFKSFGAEIEFAYQDFSSIPSSYSVPTERVKPFGTVHAVLCAKDIINEPFAVINADDFYGRESFEIMHDALLNVSKSSGVMVAYKLKNTVSLNGTVTRGICETENGILKSIIETYEIKSNNDGSITNSEQKNLDGETPVSMNMWGFHPSIFEKLENSFVDFLASISEGDIKAEYVLPSFVGEQIRSDALRITALTSPSKWFGVTYREDRDAVIQKLLQMKLDGTYPEKLCLK